MANPRQAFTENPWVDAAVELDYRGVSPMLGGEPVNDDGSPITENAEQGFARGHYEQHVGARGVVRVADQEWEIDGFGLRDHSWGPRYWQSPWWYRWLTANFGEDFGFVISIITSRDGGQRIGGVVLEDGEYRHDRRRRARDRLARRRLVPPGDARRRAHRRPGLRDHGQRALAHPAAEPPPDTRRRACS